MDSNKSSWIETVTNLAGMVGFNKVRVRWRLMNWAERRRHDAAKVASTARHAAYEHAICPNCGGIQDKSEKVCVKCQTPLHARPVQVASRFLGFALPGLSTSMLFGLLCVGIYIRMVLAHDPGSSIASFTTLTAARFGGNTREAVLEYGEWWRLGTAMLLHGGIIHLIFNIMALSQVGRLIDQAFGRSMAISLFVLTGLAASATSLSFMDYRTVSLGASGAIMGLVGAGAAYGHRRGDSAGRQVRNIMLQWTAYTMVFGFIIKADNYAHGGGFVAGAILGWLLFPLARKRSSGGTAGMVVAGLCLLLTVVFAYYAFFPKYPFPTELWEFLQNR